MKQESQQQGGSGIRIAGIVGVFVLVQLVVPVVVRLGVGDMRGSLLPHIVVPALFGILWLLFGSTLATAFRRREGSTVSGIACVGYGFLISVVATVLILLRILPSGSSGPGP